ncbi:Metallo-dependent phosphatase-like protein [Pelagophyceae sp. CCMP2097]|nr:Metallo-dependent phosphatase-like protein [Pelagophyceae sp. CCMP2097]
MFRRRGSPASDGARRVWSRVIAIGDVHGDMNALQVCLRIAGVIDGNGDWAAEPRTLLMSCGDILDRGDEDWRCLKYLTGLRRAARLQSSDVACVLGNHEVLNVCGDTRYVTPKAALSVLEDLYDVNAEGWADTVEERQWTARIDAFRPGGAGARLLADLCDGSPVARLVDGTLFCHGGLHVAALHMASNATSSADALRQLNDEASAWLLGRVPPPPVLRASASSPVWSRSFSHPAGCELSARNCASALRILDALGCERMVVGHTPQIATGINGACDDRIFRIDTGCSAYYGGPKEVLELRPGKIPVVLSSTVRFS